LLKTGSGDAAVGRNPYAGRLFQAYRAAVAAAINHRWITLAVVVAVFALALIGFGSIKSGFFPDSRTPLFFVDVWEPEGTDIRKTREDALRVSEFIRKQPGVVQTAVVIGGPHQRFTLVYDAKEPSPVYAQVIVRTQHREQIPAMVAATRSFMQQEMPWTDPMLKPLRIGPGRDARIEARFSGPDEKVLRRLADTAEAIMRADPYATDVRNDWRSPVKVATPIFDEQLARQLGVDRQELGDALKFAFDGIDVGRYRDVNRQLPIRLRAPEEERGNIDEVRDTQVWSPVLRRTVPVSQVVSGYETRWENSVIRGRDRMQTIIASANPVDGIVGPLLARLQPQIEAIELPPGYQLEWGGEYEDSKNAQLGLAAALPLGFLLMILTSIFLFGKLRQPAIIWLTVPLAIVGITVGLLAIDGAFDFMSLLGALSLIGLLIKNAIVLIEEIDQQIASGKDPYEALLDSCVSRVRPVVLAAATTILGLIPLLADAFFVNMAVTIMAGLGFASLLTLIVVPTLYAVFFAIRRPEDRAVLAAA
jgi:multidrug efflux pump subunit AcrB